MLASLCRTLDRYRPESYLAPCGEFPDLKPGEGVFVLHTRHLADDLYLSYSSDTLIVLFKQEIYAFEHPTAFNLDCLYQSAWNVTVTCGEETKSMLFSDAPLMQTQWTPIQKNHL
jgi:hypothetical protein